jgi:hypothetical protein
MEWLDGKGVEQKEGYKGDSHLNVTDWIGGPGALMTNKSVEDLTERLERYQFLQQMEAILPTIPGAGNHERYEYWLNSMKFNKSLIETALAAIELQNAVDEIKKEKDKLKKQRMAIDKALPIRLDLAEKWKQTIKILLSKVSTTGEMGMLANLEMHNYKHNQIITGHDSYLKELGVDLPAEAFPSTEYTGKTRVIVPTDESILSKGKDFYLRVRILSSEKDISGKLKWKKLGPFEYKEITLKKMDRNVFEVTIPATDITDDFEYCIEVSAGKELVTFPVTSPGINRTVVLMK